MPKTTNYFEHDNRIGLAPDINESFSFASTISWFTSNQLMLNGPYYCHFTLTINKLDELQSKLPVAYRILRHTEILFHKRMVHLKIQSQNN